MKSNLILHQTFFDITYLQSVAIKNNVRFVEINKISKRKEKAKH